MRSRALAWACAILTAGTGSGCSLLFTDAPPPRHTELPYFDCTSARFAPNIDLAVAALYGIGAVAAASNRSNQGSDETSTMIGAALFAGLFGTSAVYGYQRTASCREAKAALAERLSQRERLHDMPPPTVPGAPTYQAADPWQTEGPPPGFVPSVLPLPPPAPPPPTPTPPDMRAPGTPPAGGQP